MLSTLNDKVDTRHAALLLVDVQNDFCAEGGAMHREGRDVALVQDMVPRLERLLEAARSAGVACVWIRNVYNTGPNHYLSEVWLEQAKRRRNGAYFWQLFHDSSDPTRFVEVFMDESWMEHLRQHERASVSDREILNRAKEYTIVSEQTPSSHWLADRES